MIPLPISPVTLTAAATIRAWQRPGPRSGCRAGSSSSGCRSGSCSSGCSRARSGTSLFLFLTASVIAFLLNPLVRDLQRLRLSRGLAVAVVFLVFASAVAFVALALGSVVVDQTRSAAATDRRLRHASRTRPARPAPSTTSTGCSCWLDTHRLERIKIKKQATDWVDSLGAGEISKLTQDAISLRPGRGVLDRRDALQPDPDHRHLDLHAARHAAARARDRPALPAGRGAAADAADRAALAGYVRGQLILSTVIGLSAGVGMWVLGRPGSFPGPTGTRCCSASGRR